MKAFTAVSVVFFAAQALGNELLTPEKIEAAIEQVE